eukprot:8191121-Karenia_brevis.AAC.1
MWVLGFCIAQTGAGLIARSQQFMQLCKLQFNDVCITEYCLIARVIEMLLTFDQLAVQNIAGAELLAR